MGEETHNTLALALIEQAKLFGSMALEWAVDQAQAIPPHYYTYAAGGALLYALIDIAIRVASRPRYTTHPSLVSRAEMTLLDALDGALGSEYRIAIKPRVADIITLEGGSPRRRDEGLRKLFGMHFDFAICEPETMRVLSVIELDDRSHNQRAVKRRDRLKNEICEKAGIPLVRIKAAKGYRKEMLYKHITTKIAETTGC